MQIDSDPRFYQLCVIAAKQSFISGNHAIRNIVSLSNREFDFSYVN